MHATPFPRRLLRPLLTLAVLAAALFVITSQAQPADAATPYTVELSFDSIYFSAIDDCSGFSCYHSATAYASMNGRTTSGGTTGQGVRNLGLWGNPSGCNKTWTYAGAGGCARAVKQNATYSFGATEICISDTYGRCDAPFVKNNNKIRLTVLPGEKVRAAIHMMDYDADSGDDTMCKTEKWVGPFTATELATLNRSYSFGTAFNGNAACTITFTLKRVA